VHLSVAQMISQIIKNVHEEKSITNIYG
jgi:phosphoribosylpyrophosphate synthetase